eukprot:scaffold1172_cov180-Ochromonas_danica.AAC.8
MECASSFLPSFHDQLLEVMEEISVSSTPSRLKEKMSAYGLHDYLKLAPAYPQYIHELGFAIKHRNTERLEHLVDEVSDPDSSSYGNYSIFHTTSWESSLQILSRLSFFYTTCEKLMHRSCKSLQWESSLWHRRLFCSGRGSWIHSHVLSVFNAVHLPDPQPFQGAISINPTFASKDWAVTLSVLKQTYGLDISLGSNQSTQAVFVQDPNTYGLNDLNIFLQSQGLPKCNIGGDAAEDAHCQSVPADCNEGNLEVQYISAVGGATKTSFWKYTGDDFVLGFLLEISAMTQPP